MYSMYSIDNEVIINSPILFQNVHQSVGIQTELVECLATLELYLMQRVRN